MTATTFSSPLTATKELTVGTVTTARMDWTASDGVTITLPEQSLTRHDLETLGYHLSYAQSTMAQFDLECQRQFSNLPSYGLVNIAPQIPGEHAWVPEGTTPQFGTAYLAFGLSNSIHGRYAGYWHVMLHGISMTPSSENASLRVAWDDADGIARLATLVQEPEALLIEMSLMHPDLVAAYSTTWNKTRAAEAVAARMSRRSNTPYTKVGKILREVLGTGTSHYRSGTRTRTRVYSVLPPQCRYAPAVVVRHSGTSDAQRDRADATLVAKGFTKVTHPFTPEFMDSHCHFSVWTADMNVFDPTDADEVAWLRDEVSVILRSHHYSGSFPV